MKTNIRGGNTAMNYPKDRMYAKSHEWIKFGNDGTAIMGISDFAQHELGELVFVNLPLQGDSVKKGEPYAEVESVKAVSDVFSSLTGEVDAANEDLQDNPQMINENANEAWFVKISNITDRAELMDAEQYEAFTTKGN
jgi:glycine cleavage system H protein